MFRGRLLVLALVGLGAPAAAAAPPAAPDHVRPLREITFPRTPAAVARGRYLAEGLLQCFICHSERDWSKPGAPPREGMKGAGRVFSESTGRRLVAPNLTPDPETGAGTWTDDMLARAIREGVGHDGRALSGAMWWRAFHDLSDDDVAAVVAYLRTLPPVRHPLPPRQLPAAEESALATTPRPIRSPQPAPDLPDPVRRGAYLARLADCAGCHSAWEAPRNPGLYGGGNDTPSEKNHVFSANLTPDPSGISYYDAGLFIRVMRTGRVGARELDGAMRWVAFRNLDDQDLSALFAYLRTLEPVAHNVSNTDPPTPCPACHQEHGRGDTNRDPAEGRVALDPAVLAALAGRYRFSDGYVLEVKLTPDGQRLLVSGPDIAESELMPLGPNRFINLGSQAGTFRFERDADDRVIAIILRLEQDDRAERLP